MALFSPPSSNSRVAATNNTLPAIESEAPGFALGEASFMIVCRPRGDYVQRWKLSAAFNVSQVDRAPLDLFRQTLACGTMRKPLGIGSKVLAFSCMLAWVRHQEL